MPDISINNTAVRTMNDIFFSVFRIQYISINITNAQMTQVVITSFAASKTTLEITQNTNVSPLEPSRYKIRLIKNVNYKIQRI